MRDERDLEYSTGDNIALSLLAGIRGFNGRDGFKEALGLADDMEKKRKGQVEQEHTAGLFQAIMNAQGDPAALQDAGRRFRYARPEALGGLMQASIAEAARIKQEERAGAAAQATEQRAEQRAGRTRQDTADLEDRRAAAERARVEGAVGGAVRAALEASQGRAMGVPEDPAYNPDPAQGVPPAVPSPAAGLPGAETFAALLAGAAPAGPPSPAAEPGPQPFVRPGIPPEGLTFADLLAHGASAEGAKAVLAERDAQRKLANETAWKKAQEQNLIDKAVAAENALRETARQKAEALAQNTPAARAALIREEEAARRGVRDSPEAIAADAKRAGAVAKAQAEYRPPKEPKPPDLEEELMGMLGGKSKVFNAGEARTADPQDVVAAKQWLRTSWEKARAAGDEKTGEQLKRLADKIRAIGW